MPTPNDDRLSALAHRLLFALLPASLVAQKWLDVPREINSQLGDEIRAIADFDADGRRDLLVTRANGSISGAATFWIAFGTADGAFVPGPNQPVHPGGYQGDSFALAGDVTGDGLPDVVMSHNSTAGFQNSGFVLYRNLGGGTLAAPILTAMGSIGLTNSGVLSDWNGDDVRELAVSRYEPINGGYELRRWTYQNGAFTSSNGVLIAEYLSEVATADVTGDGLADTIVGCATDARVFVFPTLPGGGLGVPQTLTPSTSPNAWLGAVPACGDVDGDGDVDLVAVWREFNSPCNLVVFTNQGASGLASGPVQSFNLQQDTYWSGRAFIADQDGDGDGDLWLGHDLLHTLENVGGTFALRSEQRIARASGGQLYDGSDGAGTADFDGDGRPDYASGRVVMYGTGRFNSTSLPTTVSSYLRSADYDDDGDLDLVESGA
ncbi:MAG: VCBS repeat-containing protein, partial [Planctomycetota bacterium]